MQHPKFQLPHITFQQKRAFVILWLIVFNYLLFFGGTINPLIASEQFRRRIQLSSLLDPTNSDVRSLNDTFEQFLQEHEQYAMVQDHFTSLEEYEARMVEIFTYFEVKHKSDLMQYLSFDHLPTVREVMQSGSDDEDGRTIFATALLLFRGYDAWALFGPWHSWVEIILKNGTPLQILAKKGIGMKLWYLRFNDRELHFKPIQTLVFMVYELLFAAFTVIGFFVVQKLFSQNSPLRHAIKSLSIFAIATVLLFIGAFAILLLFYWVIWGV